ncbi:hypothetical protein PPERSA_00532 [Pseudocohnilembus persalinus]|uniref:Heat shock protein 70 family n=1 Tax=Pseudocohnilembus persalinus TaxID=266149 RepID=A0A0V0QI01_PSEPJ|nr:hypothetical protein PPERSA_00532 [Pseudocohnilembus persalinus]|eukprot:KRX01822.1 hypothetical protein PPERSA_00532 [Pseudocohnilembus persalinus]
MKLFLIALILGYIVQLIQSAVIGIDFGTDYFKISLIAPGKQFVIVESMSSQRKTNSAISFVQGKRFYESDAVTKKTRFPSNSFAFVKDFLGALEKDEQIFKTSLSNYDEYIYSFNEKRGTVQFELKNFKLDDEEEDGDQTIILSVEEVVGQIFKYAKTLSEKMAGSEIKDCVVTVPPHWTFARRAALVDAVQLSGLQVLNLISENSAAALYFGIDRVESDQQQLILFYNLGANNLQASLVQYDQVPTNKKTGNSTKSVPQVTVLADYSIPSVGGYYFDKAIAEFFADQIDSKPERKGKKSIKENKKAMRKLIMESVKTKEVLSSNKMAFYSSIGLYDGQDFQGNITRKQFEHQIQHLLDQLTIPIQKCLERSGKTVNDISVVELLGGGSRVPKVQKILKDYFGQVEIGTHMNGDEAMALGASYHAANFSGSFRVREILLNDGFNYQVRAEISNLDENIKEGDAQYYQKSFTLFPYKQRFGSKKTVSFQTQENMQIKLFTIDYDGNEAPYAVYNLTNVDKIKNDKFYQENTQSKVSLEFEISGVDGFFLNQAVSKYNYTKRENLSEKELKKLEKDKVRKEKKQEKEREQAEKDGVTYVPSENLEEMFKFYAEIDGETTTYYHYINKTREIDIKFKEQLLFFPALNRTEFKKSQRLIKRFDSYEERQRNLSDIKNKFEAFIYQSRDLVEDENFIKFAQQHELANLTELYQQNYSWLDSDEAFNGNYTIFSEKLQEMQKFAFPVQRRQDEAHYREEFLNITYSELAKIQNKTQTLEKEHHWLNETDIGPLKNLISESFQWLQKVTTEQSAKPIHEDPAFSITQLKPMIDELAKEYNRVRLIRQPKKDSDKKSKKQKTKNGKQKILIDGEYVEIDLDSFNKQKQNDFNFEQFKEQFEKEQKQKEQQKEEQKEKENIEQEDIDISKEENERQQQEQKQQEQEQKQQEDHDPTLRDDL